MSEISELADKLKSESDKLANYFESLTDEQWATEIYTEDAVWTIRNILAHLITSERAFIKLFEDIRQGGAGVSEDFVIDRYNASQQEKTKGLCTLDLLELFKSVRKEMINWVSGISQSDLEIKGRHPFLGRSTLREMVKMVYLHEQIHYRDIKKVVNR
jgi:hypothetical protein